MLKQLQILFFMCTFAVLSVGCSSGSGSVGDENDPALNGEDEAAASAEEESPAEIAPEE